MKDISRYFFMTLIIIQALFILLLYTDYNFLGLLTWTGRIDSFNPIKLFSPLIVFGAIKILYWLADPISKLFTIILSWTLFAGIVYGFFWLFFI